MPEYQNTNAVSVPQARPSKPFAPVMNKLRAGLLSANTNNPEDAPADSTGITMTMVDTADAALTKIYNGIAGAQVAFGQVVRFTGGRMVLASGTNRAAFPTADASPSTGNLSGVLPATPGYQAWGWEAETVYTGQKIQVRLVGNAVRAFRVLVNGRYVSKTALPPFATGSNNYLTLEFATAGTRTIRVEGSGSDQVVSFHVGPSDTLQFPNPPANKLIWFDTGDSYSEGTGATVPGLFAWTKLVGRRLGATDVRQVAVGSTGYLSNNGGLRKTVRQQVADWPIVNSDIDMNTVDVVSVASGYNDYAQPNVNNILQGEVLETLKTIRSMCPNALILVYGSHTGARGPDEQTIRVENFIRAAFNQWSDPFSVFIPIATDAVPWITGTDYVGKPNPNGIGNSGTLISADGSHPNDPGHKEIADRATNALKNILPGILI